MSKNLIIIITSIALVNCSATKPNTTTVAPINISQKAPEQLQCLHIPETTKDVVVKFQCGSSQNNAPNPYLAGFLNVLFLVGLTSLLM